jgi:hypothetical protein
VLLPGCLLAHHGTLPDSVNRSGQNSGMREPCGCSSCAVIVESPLRLNNRPASGVKQSLRDYRSTSAVAWQLW